MAEVVIDSWDKWVQVATTGIGTVESPNFGSYSDPLKITLGTDLDWNKFEDRYTTGWIPIGCKDSTVTQYVSVPLYISEFDGNGKEIKNLNVTSSNRLWTLIRPYTSPPNASETLPALEVHDLKLTDVNIGCSDFIGVITGTSSTWRHSPRLKVHDFFITGNIQAFGGWTRLITNWDAGCQATRCGFSGTIESGRFDGFFGNSNSYISESYIRADVIVNQNGNSALISQGNARNSYFIGTFKKTPDIINNQNTYGLPRIANQHYFTYAVIKNIDEWPTWWNFHPDKGVNADIFLQDTFGGYASLGKFFYDMQGGKGDEGSTTNLEPTHEYPNCHGATTAQLQDPSWLASKGFAIYSGG